MSATLKYIIEPKVEDTAIKTAEKSVEKLTDRLIKAEKQDKKLNKEVSKINKKGITETAKATDNLKNNTKKSTDEQRKYNRELKKTNKNADGLITKSKKMAVGFVGLQTLKKVTEIFISFEDKMLKVKSLVGEAGVKDFPLLTEQAKKLGATTAHSASKVAEAQGNMAQSGFKVNEILKATPAILSLASATQLQMGRASEIVSKSLGLFNLEATESARVADVITKAQAESTASAEFLASALFNVGSSANSMGFGLEDTTALIAGISRGFDNGSRAGTALNATFRDMAKNSDKINKLGIETANADGSFRQLEDIMLDLDKATKKMTDTQKKATLATIFGDEAQRAVNVLLATGAKKTKEYDESLRTATGTALIMANTMESGLGGTFRSLFSATEGLAIKIATALSPAIKGVTTIITATATALSGLINFMESGTLIADVLTSAIWGGIVAFGAYKATMVATAIQTAITATGMGAMAIVTSGLTTAFKLLNLSNPFGWIAIGITGLTLLYKKFKPFQDLVNKGAVFIGKLFGFNKKATDEINNKKLESGKFRDNNGNLISTNEIINKDYSQVQNSRLNTNTINNTVNNSRQGNVNITIPVNNSVNGREIAGRVNRAVRSEIVEYNRQELASIGG